MLLFFIYAVDYSLLIFFIDDPVTYFPYTSSLIKYDMYYRKSGKALFLNSTFVVYLEADYFYFLNIFILC